MKYVSIDIETSGLDPDNCILSFGAIIEDSNKKLPYDEVPKFYKIINQRNITGRPFALNMNKDILEILSIYQEGEPSDKIKDMVIEEDELAKEFFDFLWLNGMAENYNIPFDETIRRKDNESYPMFNGKIKPIRITAAGKNFASFDIKYLVKLPWWQKLIKVRHKVLDPGILYVDWKNDDQVPAMDLCKKRANIDGIVTHNALDDAWDVIELLRKQY